MRELERPLQQHGRVIRVAETELWYGWGRDAGEKREEERDNRKGERR
jgi:hypothetical protein